MGSRAVVVSVVAVVVLVGGAVVGDRWAHAVAQDRVAEAVRDGVDAVSGGPDVDIAGFPFLTQLAAGSLDDLTVTADAATIEGLTFQDVHVRAEDVSTAEPYTAATADLSGTVPTAALTDLVAGRTGSVDLALGVEGDVVVASTSVLGIDVAAHLVPRPAGRAIEVDVESVEIGGRTVDVADLPRAVGQGLTGLSIPVEALPDGLELTEVVVVDDGVRLTAAGTDVTVPRD